MEGYRLIIVLGLRVLGVAETSTSRHSTETIIGPDDDVSVVRAVERRVKVIFLFSKDVRNHPISNSLALLHLLLGLVSKSRVLK